MALVSLEHPREQPESEPHGRQQVQRHDVFVLGPRHLVELALRVSPGIVHEHVDPSVLTLGGAHEQIEAVQVAQLCHYRHGRRP